MAMDTPDVPERLTNLERAQLLHDNTLHRHGEMLDRHEVQLISHAAQMATLGDLMTRQLQMQHDLQGIAAQVAQRQQDHGAVIQLLSGIAAQHEDRMDAMQRTHEDGMAALQKTLDEIKNIFIEMQRQRPNGRNA
jgi:hypothetical protein